MQLCSVEPSFVLYALRLNPGCCLRAHTVLRRTVEPVRKKKIVYCGTPNLFEVLVFAPRSFGEVVFPCCRKMGAFFFCCMIFGFHFSQYAGESFTGWGAPLKPTMVGSAIAFLMAAGSFVRFFFAFSWFFLDGCWYFLDGCWYFLLGEFLYRTHHGSNTASFEGACNPGSRG